MKRVLSCARERDEKRRRADTRVSRSRATGKNMKGKDSELDTGSDYSLCSNRLLLLPRVGHKVVGWAGVVTGARESSGLADEQDGGAFICWPWIESWGRTAGRGMCLCWPSSIRVCYIRIRLPTSQAPAGPPNQLVPAHPALAAAVLRHPSPGHPTLSLALTRRRPNMHPPLRRSQPALRAPPPAPASPDAAAGAYIQPLISSPHVVPRSDSGCTA